MAVINNFGFVNELKIGGTKDETVDPKKKPTDVDNKDNTDNTEDYSLDDTDAGTTDDVADPNAEDTNKDAGEEDDYSMPDDTDKGDNNTDDTSSGDNADDVGDNDDNYELPDDTGNEDEDANDGSDPDNQSDDPNADDASGDDDYSLDDADPTDGENTDDDVSFGTDDTQDGEDPSTGNELDDLENDIFNTMTQDQRDIKEKEMKTTFDKMYNDINDYIEKINKIPKSDDNIEILEKVISSLLSLKEYVSYYIINTMDTKSYIENNIIYQKYMVSLVAVKNILMEMAKKKD